MKDNFIQLEKDNVLRLEIFDSEGNSTNQFLEFDLEDIELPLRYQELVEEDKKNIDHLKNQMLIIERKEDVKGKKLLSKNEEDKIRALNEFFKKEAQIYNMFLGENGVEKLLNGRKLGWTSLKEIDEIIEKQIIKHINISADDITKKIKEKYGKSNNNEVLK